MLARLFEASDCGSGMAVDDERERMRDRIERVEGRCIFDEAVFGRERIGLACSLKMDGGWMRRKLGGGRRGALYVC